MKKTDQKPKKAPIDYGYVNVHVKQDTKDLLREVAKETGHKMHYLADEAIRYWCQKIREFKAEIQA